MNEEELDGYLEREYSHNEIYFQIDDTQDEVYIYLTPKEHFDIYGNLSDIFPGYESEYPEELEYLSESTFGLNLLTKEEARTLLLNRGYIEKEMFSIDN
jgi:hypothetical protein